MNQIIGKIVKFFTLFFVAIFIMAACDTEVEPITAVDVIGDEQVVIGQTANYSAVISPSSRQNAKITWSVIDGTGTATITASGVLTPLTAGTVTIKASTRSMDGSKVVVIAEPITSVAIVGEDMVATGTQETYEFTVLPTNGVYESVTWAVLAGTGNAHITQAGVLTPLVAGTITVRVSIDGIIATKAVTIIIPLTGVGIDGPVEARLGTTPSYVKVLTPQTAYFETVTWGVTNGTGSATITQQGVLTPVTAGTVTVTLAVDNFNAQLQIEVIVPVETVTVSGEQEILPSYHPTYTAEILPLDAKHRTVVWSVVNGTGSATITQGGVLTPTSSGTVTVVATADGIVGNLEVVILEDDRGLGTPRPVHVLATPENTMTIEGDWEKEGILNGLDIEFARQVHDVSFTTAASISPEGIMFRISNEYDLSRMQYIAIKVTGMTTTPGVNPTIGFRLRDYETGLTLFWDQDTEVEVTDDNQWIIFRISNRYRLQTENKDLRIILDPHFTASGNQGMLTIQQVVFFGNADPVTEPSLIGPPQTAHWATEPVGAPDVDMIGGVETPVTRITASATAVGNWWGIPAYVQEDISRYTHVTFQVRLLTAGLSANPRLLVTLGDTDLQNITIDRTNTTTYVTVTVPIPVALRTEANMWSARYIQLKVNTGGTAQAVEYFIHGLTLTGDADPTPIVATRTVLGGPNVPLSGSINYVENGTAIQVAANGEPAHVLFTPTDLATLSKLEFGYSKTTGNAAARAGMNGVYVRIQGPAGITINIQQGWGDGWADESQRMFVLDGTVQEVFIIATPRSIITTGTGWFAFQFNTFIPADMTDIEIKIFEFALTAIFPEEEPVKDITVDFSSFVGVKEDTMEVNYDIDGNAIITVTEDNVANHVRAVAISRDLRNTTKLFIEVKGEIGTKIIIKLAYGNMFNYDVDLVYTFTTNEVEILEIAIEDRDALLVSNISLSIFFDLNGLNGPAEFTLYNAYLEGIILD